MRAVVQVVSRWPPTAGPWLRFQATPCEVCGGKVGSGAGFSPSTFVMPVCIISPIVRDEFHVKTLFIGRTSKENLFRISKKSRRKSVLTYCAMCQDVSRCNLTAAARFRARVIPGKVFGL
jgi:hypothetical protein